MVVSCNKMIYQQLNNFELCEILFKIPPFFNVGQVIWHRRIMKAVTMIPLYEKTIHRL